MIKKNFGGVFIDPLENGVTLWNYHYLNGLYGMVLIMASKIGLARIDLALSVGYGAEVSWYISGWTDFKKKI